MEQDNNQDQQSSFYAQNRQSPLPDQPQVQQVVTKSNRNKKRPIQKKRQKGFKRPHTNKQKQNEIRKYQIGEKRAEAIIDEMQKRYLKDAELVRKKQLACRKLTYIEELSKELKNFYISQKFLEQNGFAMFEKWLGKVNTGDGEVQPSLALRKGIFEIILSINTRSDHVARAQQLQRIVQRHKRSQIKQLRDLSEAIIKKWSQLNIDE